MIVIIQVISIIVMCVSSSTKYRYNYDDLCCVLERNKLKLRGAPVLKVVLAHRAHVTAGDNKSNMCPFQRGTHWLG